MTKAKEGEENELSNIFQKHPNMHMRFSGLQKKPKRDTEGSNPQRNVEEVMREKEQRFRGRGRGICIFIYRS